MSRTLNDDFDEDDLPGGPIDLEKGSHVGGQGGASSYSDDGGMDFDDELYGDGAAAGALELDLPPGAPGSQRSLPAPQNTHPPAHSKAPQGQGGSGVPDLAFDESPRSSKGGQSQASQTSGAHPAAPPPPSSRPDMSAPPPPHSSSGRSMAPISESGPHAQVNAPPEPPPPPPKPTPAAMIAKYPDPPPKITQAPMYALKVFKRQLELRTDLESLRRRRSPDVPLYEAALRAYDPKTFRLGMAICFAILTIATFIFFLPVIIRFMRAD